MPRSRLNVLFPVVGALLLGTLIAYVWTGESPSKPTPGQGGTSPEDLIDQQPLRSARALLSLANTADEQQLAFQAIRIADDEVDQAFAAALLGAQQHPPAQSKGSRAISARIQALQVKVQSDQQEVHRLEALVASPKRNDHGAIQEQLELAKAQLDLDQDDLGDARQDLVRSGDDAVALRQRLRRHDQQRHGHAPAAAG